MTHSGLNQVGRTQLDQIFDAVSRVIGIPRASLRIEEVKPDYPASSEVGDSSLEPFIPQTILDLPVLALKLSTRSLNGLNRVKIKTIGELRTKSGEGLMLVPGLGVTTIQEIQNKLEYFLSICTSLSDVEIDLLRDSRPPLAPLDDRTQLISVDPDVYPNLLQLIVPISRKTLEFLDYKRELDVLIKRYALDGGIEYTLQEIGDYYDISRERVRQLEAKATRKLRKVLLDDDERRCRLPRQLIVESKSVHDLIIGIGKVVTEEEIIALLQNRYSTNQLSTNLGSLRLLLDILGFSPLPQRIPESAREIIPSWSTTDILDRALLFDAVTATYAVLLKSVGSLSFFDLKVRVNRQRKNKLDSEYIKLALKVGDKFEALPEELYQVKFAELSSIADKAYRVLFDAGQPLTLRAINKEINHQLTKAGVFSEIPLQSLQSQLADKRFVSQGRRGLWGLSEWKSIRNITVVNMMKEFFHLRKKDANVEEIYEYVKLHRPDTSKQSVYTYLSSRTDIFVKVSQNTYELVNWGSKAYEARPKLHHSQVQKQISNALKQVFQGHESEPMKYSKLVQDIVQRTGIPSSTVYSRLSKSSLITLERDHSHSRAKLVRYTAKEESANLEKNDTKNTIRLTIQGAIRSYLMTCPNHRAPLAEVAKHVKRLTGCNKTTFYRYLSELEDSVKKEVENKRIYCYLVSAEPVASTLSFPQVEGIKDQELRDNIRKAINNMSIDNIDMGLFYLGKIFEHELKTFLLAAQAKEAYSVTRKDMDRLVSMIDCLERNAIVTQKHHLTLLREQRNDRAHGELPDLAERHRLLQYAPFLGDLYIKYIILIREKRDQL